MKTNLKKIIAIALVLIAFTVKTNAQIDRMANYVYALDSVAGFDEQAASAGALNDGFYGKEFKVAMYRAKREYVKQRYHLKSLPPLTLFQNQISSRPAVVPGGACNNEDFELATSSIIAPASVQGWSLQSGTNNNSCQQPVLNANLLYTVYTSGIVDSKIPGTVSSYFDASSNTSPSGSAFIRLNDDQAGAKAVRLTKSFIPTPTSALFQYAYIAVIEDGSHPCCDQAGFNIKVTITNTVTNTSTLLACPNISVAVPGAACSFTIPSGGPSFSPCPGAPGWSYANWTASAIDLTQYIGSLVKIDVTVVDCDAGGHGAYVYFDAKCSPMSITGNGNPFPAGTPSVTLPTCGATGATICATPGLGPYSWSGPNVPLSYGVPSMTNQCFTSSLSATYTLYMNPPGSCAPISRIITTTITPAPLLLANIVQATCGGTTAVITVTPSGSAISPSSLIWSPTPLSLNSSTTVGSYTIPPGPNPQVVSITALDPLGCSITQTVGVNPAAPYPTFTLVNVTGSQSITCATPSVDLSAVSNYTYGTLNYFWVSNTATFNTSNVNITNSTTIVCIITDTVTNCQASKTITIGANISAPSTSVFPLTQNITCSINAVTTVTATANPSVNVTHNILSPYGGTFSATSYSLIYLPACGVFTHVVVNDVNGCSTTKLFTVTCNQGFPTFSVVSPQSFTLGCSSFSCAQVSITQPVTFPPGGPVSYNLLSPSSPTGITGPISVFTVCSPGTYTVVTKDNTSSCETRIQISILQNAFSPNISAVMDRQILDCNNPKVVLKGVSLTPNVDYLWSFPGSPGSQSGDTLAVPANFALKTNTIVANYTLAITNLLNACKSTSVITIYQNLFSPNAFISGLQALTCITQTITLTNQSTTGIPPSTLFTTGGAVIASWEGPTPQEPKSNSSVYLAQTPGVYTMTAKDSNNGCTSVKTHTIADQKNYPVLNNPPPDAVVLDCGSTTQTLAPTVSSPTTGLLNFSWTGPPSATISGQTTKVLTTNTIGEYKVVVLNPANGCKSTAFIEVINGGLKADFEPDHINGFAPLTVNFTNKSSSTNSLTGTNGITSVWNFGNGNSVIYNSVVTASTLYNQPGSYTVTLFATKGTCQQTVRKTIYIDVPSKLIVPNVFTPNGDGVNDFFFLNASNLSKIHIKIIDRWGHLVYELESDKGNILWDGKNQAGVEAAEGTYFYTIKATGKDDQVYNSNGTVNIIR